MAIYSCAIYVFFGDIQLGRGCVHFVTYTFAITPLVGGSTWWSYKAAPYIFWLGCSLVYVCVATYTLLLCYAQLIDSWSTLNAMLLYNLYTSKYASAWLPITDIQLGLWCVRSATNMLSLGCTQLITLQGEAQHDADILLHHRRFVMVIYSCAI